MMKGYEQKKYPVATKRYVQWLELESDEEAIREYRRLHSEGVQWKEIRDGIRQVGIPRQAEWEEVVGKFQKCGKGATSDEKWHMMERIFYLYD